MGLFRKAKPEVEPPGPFDSWEIVTPVGMSDLTLHGYMPSHVDQSAMLRYIDAVANGLRAEGFDPVVTLARKQVALR